MKITSQDVKGWFDEKTGHWNWTLGMEIDPDGVDFLTPDQVERANKAYDQMQEIITKRYEPKQVPERSGIVLLPGQPFDPLRTDPEPPKMEVNPNKPYDEVKKRWSFCPKCGTTKIDHISAAGRTYQACMKDRMFLQPDGTGKPMKPIGAKEK